MRFFAFVLLAAVAMADSEPKADAEAYTLWQVATGLPIANALATGHPHNVGVITNAYAPYAAYGHFYGKCEADSEADAYTIGQVYSGLAPGVVTGVDYGHGLVHGVGAIGNRAIVGYGGLYGGYAHGFYGKPEADAYTIPQAFGGYARGVITGIDYGHGLVSGYGAVGNRAIVGGLYGGYTHGFYGKREADSEADAYTIGQVYSGLAPGVVTGVDYGHGLVHGVGAIGNRAIVGYG